MVAETVSVALMKTSGTRRSSSTAKLLLGFRKLDISTFVAFSELLFLLSKTFDKMGKVCIESLPDR